MSIIPSKAHWQLAKLGNGMRKSKNSQIYLYVFQHLLILKISNLRQSVYIYIVYISRPRQKICQVSPTVFKISQSPTSGRAPQ